MGETVTITRKEYNCLVADSDFLDCLVQCGVDNWDGYSEACRLNDDGEE